MGKSSYYRKFIYHNSSFEAVSNLHKEILRDYSDKKLNTNRAIIIQNFLNDLKEISIIGFNSRSSRVGGVGVLNEIMLQHYNQIVQTLGLTDSFDIVQTDKTGLKFEELITEIFNEITYSDETSTFNNSMPFMNTGKVEGTTPKDYAAALRLEAKQYPELDQYPDKLKEILIKQINERALKKLNESIHAEKSFPKQMKADIASVEQQGLYINETYNDENIATVVNALENSTFSLKSYSSKSIKFGHTNFYKVMQGISQGFGGQVSSLLKAQTDVGLGKFIYYAGKEVLDIRHAQNTRAKNKHYRRTLFPSNNVAMLRKHLYDFQIIYEITGRGLHVVREQYLNIDGREVQFIIYNDRRKKNGKIYVIPVNLVIQQFLERNSKVPNVYTRSMNSEFSLSANILANLMKTI